MTPDQDCNPDLFALGQKYFKAFIEEFASYGLEADSGIELRPGKGLLCYYSFEDRDIYLSVPDLNSPLGKLKALFFRSLLGFKNNTELLSFFQLFIPQIIAHELAHHYRHRYNQIGDSKWHEEQVANKLAVAVRKHRLSPQQKAYARKFLRQAIGSLSKQIEEKNVTIDSYYDILHALNVSGTIDVADFENIELLQSTLGVSAEALLKGSGRLSAGLVHRLDEREEIIAEIDEVYAADQVTYIYNHLGWLYLDLTSRETEYVDEFAKNYLNLGAELLPVIAKPDHEVSSRAIQACFKAYQDTYPHSEVAGRFFYKRYRSLLLAKLQGVELSLAAQTDRLKRETTTILEEWCDEHADTLDYLSQLAPPDLRSHFPHLIAENLDAQLELPAHLPTETDRRLWQHIVRQTDDRSAANTLHRLALLDQTEVYHALPAELLLELGHLFNLVKFIPGETVIWQGEYNDDVYFLVEGKLEALVTKNKKTKRISMINPGEMFGEIAFFTEDPRYATVRALEPSTCFVLTDADLQLVAYNHPTILMKMAAALAKKLTNFYPANQKETI
jgi:CRP-like cAMP-binding protein